MILSINLPVLVSAEVVPISPIHQDEFFSEEPIIKVDGESLYGADLFIENIEGVKDEAV